MSTENLCHHCGDPAVLFQERKEPFWPFRVVFKRSFCYECYQEVVNHRIPKLTDSSHRSCRGAGVRNRRNLWV